MCAYTFIIHVYYNIYIQTIIDFKKCQEFEREQEGQYWKFVGEQREGETM